MGASAVAEENDVNRNGQRLLREATFKGTDHQQYIWALQCERNGCGYVYGANGTDFHQRRCPKCDNGMPGI
jgi:hypothetical protein